MRKLLLFLFLVAVMGGIAVWEQMGDLARSLALIGGMGLVLVVLMLTGSGAAADNDVRSHPPGGDQGPDPVYYPDPPERAPDLRGPGPERFAERGQFREEAPRPMLPPMRREQDVIIEVPDWPVKTGGAREKK